MSQSKSTWVMLLVSVSCLLFGGYLVLNSAQTLSADDKAFYLSSAKYALEVTSVVHRLSEAATEEQVTAILEGIKSTDRAYRGLNTSQATREGQKIMDELVLEAYRAADAQQTYLVTDNQTQREAVQQHMDNIDRQVAALEALLKTKHVD